MKNKNKKRVQNGVGNGANQHGRHGNEWAAIGPDKVRQAMAGGREGGATQNDARIVAGVRQEFIAGAGQPQEWIQVGQSRQ